MTQTRGTVISGQRPPMAEEESLHASGIPDRTEWVDGRVVLGEPGLLRAGLDSDEGEFAGAVAPGLRSPEERLGSRPRIAGVLLALGLGR